MSTAQDQQSRAEFESVYRSEAFQAGIPDGSSKEVAFAAWQAARALPAGEPFGYVRRRNGKFTHEFDGIAASEFDAVYTAAQVQAMLEQGMEHACNLWVDPENLQYVVDSCDHPTAELIPAYIAAAPRPPAEQEDSK